MAMKVIDISGIRSERLLVLNEHQIRVSGNKSKTYWKCVCDCGKIGFYRADALKNGSAKSCGCKLRDGFSGKYSHGETKTSLHRRWGDMKQRCLNKKNLNYHKYGARGICVCDEWKNSFEKFRDWANSNGYDKDLTIERIDNNGNYEPSNCRWITNRDQQKNKRNTVNITHDGVTKNVADWASFFGIHRSHLGTELKRGKKFKDIYNKYLS